MSGLRYFQTWINHPSAELSSSQETRQGLCSHCSLTQAFAQGLKLSQYATFAQFDISPQVRCTLKGAL